MTDVRRVSVPVDGAAPESASNAYVVGRDDALLVDPGGRTDELDRTATARSVAHVAVTHHHADHVDAVGHYAATCDATVWARAGREDDFAAATGVTPDRTFRSGTAVPAADGQVSVLDSPGHAPEHVAFLVGEDALVGDLAVAEGSVAVAAPGGDLRAYLTSLRRLRTRNADRLLPGHGPPVDDPRRCCDRLVEHRIRRERRVADAVAGGASTLDEVTDASYAKDISDVRALTRATVRAHLEKLVVEGRITWDGERAGTTDA